MVVQLPQQRGMLWALRPWRSWPGLGQVGFRGSACSANALPQTGRRIDAANPQMQQQWQPQQQPQHVTHMAEGATRQVILTFSGVVPVSSGSAIWSKIAQVMKAANANIANASGTFLQIHKGLGRRAASIQGSNFSVSAFGACISPSLPPVDYGDEDLLACTMYLKVRLSCSGVDKMMCLLRTESPLQVYTVSHSHSSEGECSSSSSSSSNTDMIEGVQQQGQDAQTGTVYLFGLDRPGQLCKITKVLMSFGVSILHLRVKSGTVAFGKCDFVSDSGGPLAENSIRIAFDGTKLDVPMLRRKIQDLGMEVGYCVTCVTIDSHNRLRSRLPSYNLRMKAFILAYLKISGETRGLVRRRPQKNTGFVASSRPHVRRQQRRGRVGHGWRRRCGRP